MLYWKVARNSSQQNGLLLFIIDLKDQYSTMASTVFDDDSSHTIRHNEYEPLLLFSIGPSME